MSKQTRKKTWARERAPRARKTPENLASNVERAVISKLALMALGALVETSVQMFGEDETERLLFMALRLSPKKPGETHQAWRKRTKGGRRAGP